MAVIGMIMLVGNTGNVAVAVTVIVGVGDVVGVVVMVGVCVGVLLGGSVGVTNITSASTVTISKGDNTSPEVGVATMSPMSGVGLKMRVGKTEVAASRVESSIKIGPPF
jgi:hypothetical protein